MVRVSTMVAVRSVVNLRLNMGRHGLKLNKALLRVGLNLLI